MVRFIKRKRKEKSELRASTIHKKTFNVGKLLLKDRNQTLLIAQLHFTQNYSISIENCFLFIH